MSEPVVDATAIAERLAVVRDRIAVSESAAGRDAGCVRLVAVSKRLPAAAVLAAVRAGHRDFGENYFQEAAAKIDEVSAALLGASDGDGDGDSDGDAVVDSLRWHMIGHLQSNKAAKAVGVFDLLHGLDSSRTAHALSRKWAGRQVEATAAGDTGGAAPVAALLQIKLGGGEQRAGIAPDQAADFLRQVADLEGLRIDGLMGVAPAGAEPRPHFAALRELAERLRSLGLPGAPLREISAGMTGDFEAAIAEGATIVRVGTAVFGARPQ